MGQAGDAEVNATGVTDGVQATMTRAGGLDSRAGISLIVVFLVAAGALAFRLPRLSERPMHGDEANQAYKTGILLETGAYEYDPVEHHGPIIYYLALPAAWLSGAKRFADTTEITYRIIPVLFGAGIVLLLAPLIKDLGGTAVVTAALLTAVSPAMLFYSRYYIQEIPLVFFEFGAIVAGWRYLARPSLGLAIAAGLCLGLAHASKETCVIAFASYAGAALCTYVWTRRRDGTSPSFPAGLARMHLVAAIAAASLVSALFFSSFLTHPRGVLDSILTYGNYTHKALVQQSHEKPWPYYLQLLLFTRRAPYPWFSEAFVLALAAVGAVHAFVARGTDGDRAVTLKRFLAFYSLGMLAAYSAIPTKTPWCLLNFYQPLIVLGGIGAAALIHAVRPRPLRVLLGIVLLGLSAQLAAQAYRAAYVYYADVRNPYVYAHTSTALMRLVERVRDIAAVSPEGKDMLIHVVDPNRDYWPLPWYLRAYSRVGYWNEVPTDVDASMLIVSPKVQEEVNAGLSEKYQIEFHSLRPRVFLLTYVRADLWEAFIETRR